MTILDRYITKEFLRLFALLVGIFTSLFMVVEFFERIRMFLSNNALLYQILSYFFFMIPMMVSQTLPASVLLASLLTFSSMSRNAEITAMKSNGISIYRMSMPVLIASVLLCIIAFLNSEFVMPYSNQRADHIVYVDVQKREPLGTFKQNQIWYKGINGIYNFKMFDPKTNVLQGITVNYLDKDFKLTMRIDAEKAEWKNDNWLFSNLLITRFTGGEFPLLEWVSSKIVDLPERPSDFNIVQQETEKMGFVELRKYVKKLQAEGYDATRYLVDMHGKISFTFVSVILAVIGIPFSLMKTERSGGIMQSISVGIIIGFSYWIVHAFAMSLGRSGTTPPIISAWFANIIFCVTSAVMFYRVKT